VPGPAARLLADGLVVFHLAFVLFVLLGGLLALRWPRVAWLHVPCAVWGVAVELLGWVCPLTPLENELRGRAGLSGYAGGFIERYLVPVLYPERLDRTAQGLLALFALAVNVAIYARLLRRRRRPPRP
jgi:hypothetical protein